MGDETSSEKDLYEKWRKRELEARERERDRGRGRISRRRRRSWRSRWKRWYGRKIKSSAYQTIPCANRIPSFRGPHIHIHRNSLGAMITNAGNCCSLLFRLCEPLFVRVLLCVCICKQFVLDYRKVFGKAVAKENRIVHTRICLSKFWGFLLYVIR